MNKFLLVCLILLHVWNLRAEAQETGSSDELPGFSIFASDTLSGVPVSLTDLVALAMQRNITYLFTRMDSDITASTLNVARGAFDPSYTATSSASRVQGTTDVGNQRYSAGLSKRFGTGTQIGVAMETTRSAFTAPQLPDQTRYTTGLTVSFSQPILEGYRTADAPVRTARYSNQAAVERTNRAMERLIGQIEIAYWNLAEAESVVRIRAQSVSVAQILLFRNEELSRRDLASEYDVITAQSGLALRQSNLVDAQRARIDASDELMFLAYGEEAAQRVRAQALPLKTTGVEIEDIAVYEYLEAETEAIATRRDLEAVRQDVSGIMVSVNAAKNALRPRLDFIGQIHSADTGAARFGDAFGGLRNDLNWSFGLQLSNFFGNRSDRNTYSRIRYQHEQQRLRMKDTENTIRQEVRAAIRAVRTGRERLQFAEAALRLADRQLEAERARLDLGLGDSFRVLQTEQNRAATGLNAARARFSLARAITSYKVAMGRIQDAYEINEPMNR